MSDDLIKRSDAIKALNCEKSDWNCDYNVPIDNCIKRLNKVKSADRAQGEWKSKHNGYWTCSECGLSFLFYAKGNYCPNCGARMKGADDEE